ncbi:hypothetical protein [Bosea sp. 685]|uniref:hypothetical protein n=1 Tax=Bosea sp. 685 TaxID=3080057 RepID=UPI002893149C|nr:hypothetical protein [Bosea sp. 685]WNJ88475.1 hypothetical protein RMR04_18900 [Bosea sp. 685]
MSLKEMSDDYILGKADSMCSDSQRQAGTALNASNVITLPFGGALPEGGDVERINQFEFYEFGRALKALTRHYGDTPANAVFFDLTTAESLLLRALSGSPMPLGVCRASAVTLQRYISGNIDQLVNRTGGIADAFKFPDTNSPPIHGYALDYMRVLISTFETVFQEEMREAATYFVPRRGIYHTPALVDAADETFPADLVYVIPEKARIDWRSAGRCLAFNLLSASGFHVARAVEATLESYYQLFSGKPGKTLVSWNDYIKELDAITKAQTSPAPSDKTIAELKQMKDDYRNPIMHPRVVLSEGDARMLFANGESLIIAMAQEIEAASHTGVQPNLQLVAGPTQP